ncbi:MAG: ribosomal-processing cysteine protease Prp [Clostridia bacterium]|nr:ribosomal-processing cysteine protease Prp [Clostridia bacterium]MBQ2963373.1 ribosomal-processing cysteine protease Prp [Clostridia bacterium]MBQ6932667.1 ribosomal-processing cysteine protease Prp [Clostridia bacterium]
MIRFKFVRSGKINIGFECTGHAGYAQSGQDIVCAAVSSAAYLTANTITDTFGAKAEISVDDGYMSFVLTEEDAQSVKLLDGLEAHIRALAKDYPRSIKVIYGGNTNA